MASSYTHINSIDEVLSEVKYLLRLIYPDYEFKMFEQAFNDVIDLFDGNYDGYQKCNTPFHNLQHTIDCLIAMIRLIHGAYIEKLKFTAEETELGLISTLIHDTGYIQTVNDTEGSGAKYTLVHVKRSGEFLKKYFEKNNYAKESIDFCLSCINYTGLGTEIAEILGDGGSQDMMGQMLGTADLVGQMADHAYLEKLLHLADEFKEGSVPGYDNTEILLKKTKAFYITSRGLLKNEYGGVVKYIKTHFQYRWNINKNIYLEAINKQINYLEHILEKYPEGYLKHLKRKGTDFRA